MNKVKDGRSYGLSRNFIEKRCWKAALTVFLICCLPLMSLGQIVEENPGCPAGFGIDADIQANYFGRGDGFCLFGGSDDWVDYMPGLGGIGIIDETDSLIEDPIEDNIVVCVGPKPNATSIHGGELVDAIYIRDNIYAQSYIDGTFYQQEGSKNIFNPNTGWDAGPGGGPQKNDLVDMFSALRRDNDGLLWFLGAASTRAEQGSHHIDYEFFQKDIYVNETNDGWVSLGEDYGRTAWKFNIGGSGDVTLDRVGDLLFSFDFDRGGTNLRDVTQGFLLWMSEADYNEILAVGPFTLGGGVAIAFTEDFETDDNVTGEQFGFARIEFIEPVEPSENVFTAINVFTEQGPSWKTWANNSVVDVFEPVHFSEVGVNLSAFGLDFVLDEGNCSRSLFATLVVKTRSSFSFTADLKDFAKPAPFGTVEELTVECGETPTITCDETSVDISASILGETDRDVEIAWYDPDGLFLGTTASGETLTVEECGTYEAIGRYLDDQECVFDTVYCEVLCDTIPPACIIEGTNEYCEGTGPVTITVLASEGTPPYTLSWNTGATTASIEVFEGTYTATVTDAKGCSSSCEYTVTENPNPACTIEGPTEYCEGTGPVTITAVPSGGTAPYTISWSTGATTASIDVLEGTYTATVTDAKGCVSTCMLTVTENPNPACTIEGPTEYCEDTGPVTITAVPSGGTAPYTYSWSTGATSASIDVNEGTYTATVTDAKGCISTCMHTVTENPNPACTIDGPIEYCEGTGPVTITAVPSGGTAPYTISWSTGATTASIDVSEGTYTATVTDAKGCVSTCMHTVTENPNPACTIEGPTSYCTGSGPVTITAVPSGGTAPYTISWSTGATTASIDVLEGTYTATVTDAKGCVSTCMHTVTENPNPACTIEGPTEYCEGTGPVTITAIPSGGVGPYTYSWSTGAASASIDVTEGTYTATVTDALGCTSTCMHTVTENPNPACTIDGPSEYCEGTGPVTITAVPSGGTAPYTILWSTGAITASIDVLEGTYTATVTDAKGCVSTCMHTVTENPNPACTIDGPAEYCDGTGPVTITAVPSGGTAPYTISWSTGATTASIDVLEGTYTATVTDAKGCVSTCMHTVTENPNPACTIEGPTMYCEGDGPVDISVVPSGGTAPYTYLWNTGATTSTISVLQGDYSVTVTDSKGCTSTCEHSVMRVPPPVCSIASTSGTTCHPSDNNYSPDGSITASAFSGTGEYMFKLDGIADDGSIITRPYQSDSVFTDLPGGDYTITVKDENNCSSSCDTRLNPPLPVPCNIEGPTEICEDETGNFCVSEFLGDDLATFSWEGPDGGIVSTDRCTGPISEPGTYTVTMTLESGCIKTCSEDLIVYPNPPCSITVDDATGGFCAGEVEDASYSWTFPDGSIVEERCTGPIFLGGTYTVVITDGNGCTSTCSEELVVGDIFCTFTQGYYGNPGGLHCDGSGTYELIDSFLQRDGYILLGDSAAGNSIIFFEGDAQCIIDRLPGGGPPKALNGNGSCADPGAAGVAVQNSDGRFRNVLLAQTLTLALNLRLDPYLATLEFADSFAIIMSTDSCGGAEPGAPIPDTERYAAVPPSWIGYTVADVFEVANAALAGTVPQPELRDLAVNVGWINETFDECVYLAGWLSDLPPVAVCEDITVEVDTITCDAAAVVDGGSFDPDGDEEITVEVSPEGPYPVGTTEVTITVSDPNGQSDQCTGTVTVTDPHGACEELRIGANLQPAIEAHPNPTTERVRFVFSVPETGRVRVELLNEQGMLVNVPYNGNAEAKTDYTIDMDLSSLHPGIYYYRLVSGQSRKVKKLIILN